MNNTQQVIIINMNNTQLVSAIMINMNKTTGQCYFDKHE